MDKLTDEKCKELLEYKAKVNCEMCDLKGKGCCITCTYNLIKQFLEIFNRLQAENEDLFYKLTGVMHSVDKWLDGDELKQDEVNRAATMREKTLQIVEYAQKAISLHNADIKRAKTEAYKEFAERLKEIDGKDNHTFDDCASLLVSEEYKKGRYEKTRAIWQTIDNLLKEMVGDSE